MYVCVCHAVTEDDVRGHLASGATSPKAVRVACGMRPGCGACVKRIRALLAERAECAAERAECAAGRSVVIAVGAAVAVGDTVGTVAVADIVAERAPAA